MKVIFLEDVPRVARAGEIKEVTNGYGRNYLIPHKLAVLVNPQAIIDAEAQIKARTLREAQTEDEMIELAAEIDGKEVVIKARAGMKDRLYGSITSADITAGLKNTTGAVVDKKKIELDNPIRQLGSYEVSIRLTKDIIPKIMVTVTEEEQ